MERFDYRAGDMSQGAIALVLDLANTYERVSLPVVWVLGDTFQFSPERFLRAPCGYFEHQRRVQFEGCVAESLQVIAAILLGSHVELFALSRCAAGCIKRSDEGVFAHPPMKLAVFVDDVTAFMEGRNREL